ncbi:uncharacterized protein [Amphiura filiformis]|uniref:uncharacterized protein n=1 Tax=Amphiura filiformis TaxID=82378 RepID=UPI003B21022D
MTSLEMSLTPKAGRYPHPHHLLIDEAKESKKDAWERKRDKLYYKSRLPVDDSPCQKIVLSILHYVVFLGCIITISYLLYHHRTMIDCLEVRVGILEARIQLAIQQADARDESEEERPNSYPNRDQRPGPHDGSWPWSRGQFPDKPRNRRSIQATDMGNDSGYVPNMLGTDDAHPFIHVTGITSERVTKEEWFSWHTGDEEKFQDLSISFLPFIHNKYVEIVQPGYYFIYSQVSCQDREGYKIGHEVVKRLNCGRGKNLTLLTSTQWQIPSARYGNGKTLSPDDSGYAGGIFYLSTNDLVGVRPLQHSGRFTDRYVADQGTGTYFGMFLLSADTTARVERQRNCIDEI